MSFIPEPSKTDDTWASRGEGYFSWISRSTLPRASAARRFLNTNLAALPEPGRDALVRGLENRWKSSYFELIVARTLQLLGATVELEKEQANGRRPDFEAHFPDGTVVVEAMAPVIDGEIVQLAKNRNPLLDIVESHAPPGWRLSVDELPNLGPADSKQALQRVVKDMLAVPPPLAGSTSRMKLQREVPGGMVAITLVPGDPEGNPIWLEPSLVDFSDAVERIRRAVSKKRAQVRNGSVPAFLAIDGTGAGLTDVPEFDQALLGARVEIADRWHRVVGARFDANGAFRADTHRADPPTFAGALAYVEVGLRPSPDPILYLHPRFTGDLPEGLLQLERRTYRPGRSSVDVVPARTQGLLEQLGFVTED
jgi:hypothetical protein